MRSNQVKAVKREDSLINLSILSTIIIIQMLTLCPFPLRGAGASKKGEKSVVSYSLHSRMGKQING